MNNTASRVVLVKMNAKIYDALNQPAPQWLRDAATAELKRRARLEKRRANRRKASAQNIPAPTAD